ncbi:hypothetical protein SFRURICE_017314 [Spodoptera frugiperda]|nr:hypothetical protein SFRURICE_017314 [Spodoptera frugiperda]
MPRKRKSNLANSSSRARAAKLARSLESEEDSQIRRTLDAERHAAQRAAETFEHTQTRHNLDADRHAAQRAAENPQQTQARQIKNCSDMITMFIVLKSYVTTSYALDNTLHAICYHHVENQRGSLVKQHCLSTHDFACSFRRQYY